MNKSITHHLPFKSLQIASAVILTCLAIYLANSMSPGEGLGAGLRLMFSPLIFALFWAALLPLFMAVKIFVKSKKVGHLFVWQVFLIVVLFSISTGCVSLIIFRGVAPHYFQDTAEACDLKRNPSKDFLNTLGQRMLYLSSSGKNQFYWVAETETTQKQYFEVIGKNPSYFNGVDRPVENLTYAEAVAFVNTLNVNEKSKNIAPKEYTYRLQNRYESWCHYAETMPREWRASSYQPLPPMTHNVNQGKPNRLGIKGAADNVGEMYDDGAGVIYFGAGSFERPNKSADEWWRLDQFPDQKSRSVGFRIALAGQ